MLLFVYNSSYTTKVFKAEKKLSKYLWIRLFVWKCELQILKSGDSFYSFISLVLYLFIIIIPCCNMNALSH